MPTIFYVFGLRFHFYTREHEPIHIHVENADGVAKFDIEQEVILKVNNGLKPKDLKLAESIIEENRELLITEWKKVFGN